MRMPGVKTLRQSARWLRSRFSGGALILGYHRVAKVDSDSHGLCVSPQHFAEQLEALRRLARPVALHELVRGLQTGTLPRRAVALTFDDGYLDVLQQAYPLLEAYQVPATVFVVSDYLGRQFWWDTIAEENSQVRSLTSEELCRLAGTALIDVGAHSVSHPTLAALPAGEQWIEIEESKAKLEEILGQAVHAFSYPHGSTSAATREMVRSAGYDYACSSANDVARAASDRFELPRFWPQDWNGETFERWLRWWL